jgi:hypothetical protein
MKKTKSEPPAPVSGTGAGSGCRAGSGPSPGISTRSQLQRTHGNRDLSGPGSTRLGPTMDQSTAAAGQGDALG